MRKKNTHVPVMLNEVLSALELSEGKKYIDCTFGYGGYTKAILDSNLTTKVFAYDRDSAVEKIAQNFKKEYKDRFKFKNERFSLIKEKNVDGIVFDVGLSSIQLDDPDRGFSFMDNGPLDMRMNQLQEKTAKEILNTLTEEAFASYLKKYSDEKNADKIANIVISNLSSINTTYDLAKTIEKIVPKSIKKHPATKTFQTLRIIVNQELEELNKGVEEAAKLINKNGKIIVVTFHRGEEQIIKEKFKNLTSTLKFKKLKQTRPTHEEVKKNPRSRSAIMHTILRL